MLYISLSNFTPFSVGPLFILDSQRRTINHKKYFTATQTPSSIDWIFLYPLKFMCWNLTSYVMVLGRRVFGRWLGHEGGALMNGISNLIKGSPERPCAPSALWWHKEKTAVSEPERGPSRDTETASAWTMDFPASRIEIGRASCRERV